MANRPIVTIKVEYKLVVSAQFKPIPRSLSPLVLKIAIFHDFLIYGHTREQVVVLKNMLEYNISLSWVQIISLLHFSLILGTQRYHSSPPNQSLQCHYMLQGKKFNTRLWPTLRSATVGLPVAPGQQYTSKKSRNNQLA